jgi:hypothetical protein
VQKISPFLWFDSQAEEAANFYVSIFSNSRILKIVRYGAAGPGPEGAVMTVAFQLDGQEITALNGGPHFQFTEAISFVVSCDSQAEIDSLWQKTFRRRHRKPLRLAQGLLRPVVAGGAGGTPRTFGRQGSGQVAARHAGHAEDEKTGYGRPEESARRGVNAARRSRAAARSENGHSAARLRRIVAAWRPFPASIRRP